MSRGASFPVGKVDFIQIHPVTFSEFLQEAAPELSVYLEQIEKIEPIPDLFFNQLAEKLKIYYLTGGMPEAIAALLESKDVSLTQEILQNVLNANASGLFEHVDRKIFRKSLICILYRTISQRE